MYNPGYPISHHDKLEVEGFLYKVKDSKSASPPFEINYRYRIPKDKKTIDDMGEIILSFYAFSLAKKGERALREGNYKEAESLFISALKLQPTKEKKQREIANSYKLGLELARKRLAL
jgi:hypothetical protein